MASLYQSLTCEREDSLVVRDANGHALAYIYFEEEPGRGDKIAPESISRDVPLPPPTGVEPMDTPMAICGALQAVLGRTGHARPVAS